MSITLTQIAAALDTTFSAILSIPYVHVPSEMREGMQDAPLLQIYPADMNQDPTGDADRTTFRAVVRQTVQTWYVDLYARQTSDLGEDMAILLPLADAIVDKLEEQDTKPYFGLDGIQAFSWSGQRVTFVYGQPEIKYAGYRFVLTIRIF